MPWLRSLELSTAPATGSLKLGQPVPLSNFVFDTNSGCPQPTQTKVPGRFSWFSAQLPGRSVPCRRITWYCSGVSRRRHSSSVRVTGNCLVSMVPLLAVCRGLDRIDFFSPVMHGLPRIHLLRKKSFEVDGLPGHKRVYARLRRAMPGNDGFA